MIVLALVTQDDLTASLLATASLRTIELTRLTLTTIVATLERSTRWSASSPSRGTAATSASAETAAAATLFFASYNGVPVSTTHTITGAIVAILTYWIVELFEIGRAHV